MSLRNALAVAAQNGAWIKLVTSNLDKRNGLNQRAIRELIDGKEGMIIRQRIRILSDTKESPGFIHAKVVVVDGERGYLGSANLSRSGLSSNFEIGTALAHDQAETLDRLFSTFEADGLLADCGNLPFQH
jgi:phosphatidylserine/phosphatidylglycerophosphate/cardiolipin synthase-like enzyme